MKNGFPVAVLFLAFLVGAIEAPAAGGPVGAAPAAPGFAGMAVPSLQGGSSSLGGGGGLAPAGNAPAAPIIPTINYQSQQAPAGQGQVVLKNEAPSQAQSDGARGEVSQAPVSSDAGKAAGRQPSSSIERMLNPEGSTDNSKPLAVKPVTQFGYSFFGTAAGFAPLADVPVAPDYIVGPGDQIVVTSWGVLEGTYTVEVNRSGEITLPGAGALKVWGVPFGKLQEVIKRHLGQVYKDFQLNVNIGKLRLMKVYLVGEVANPGDYNISSLSTLINALAAAGGPTKNGTLRSIQVIRSGKVVDTVDLYQFFMKGDKSRDIRLQSGDTIYVPVIGRIAGVAGNVRRPAIYELKTEETLKDVLALAEGINPTGYLQRVQVTRVAAHEKMLVNDFSLDPRATEKSLDELTSGIKIQDLDLIKVFPIDGKLRGYVRLDGYVLRPGDYALKPGMRIKDLLAEDNILPETYPEAAEVTRLFLPDFHPEKIFIHFHKALAGDPQHNLELHEFDTVRIFSRFDMEEVPKVRISGEVQRPGEYRLLQGMTLRDLVLEAGNTKKTAFMKNAEITRLDIKADSVKAFPLVVDLGQAVAGDPEHNIKLQSFDEVLVRKMPNWMEETDRYVVLKGEVVFPGVYPIYKGERLSSVIERAGGYTDKAYLKGAKFTRKAVREIQQKRMEELILKTEADIAQKQQDLGAAASTKEESEVTRIALDNLKRTLEKLKTARAEGRVAIRISPLAEMKGTVADLEVMGGDTLEIPQSPMSVMVLGEVWNPAAHAYIPSQDVSDYLKLSGGVTRNAEEDDMYIVRADGTVESRQHASKFLFFFDGFQTASLYPGDTVVVPQRLDKVIWMREIKDITTILGQIALAAGVLIAAGL